MNRPDSLRWVLLGSLATALLLSQPAVGDLNTSVQPSLEWLVDTSDVIFVATVGGDSPGKGIKPDGEFLKTTDDSIRSFQLNRFWPKAPERRLMFLRRTQGDWRVVRSIDLDHPLASSSTSAITADGVVLEDADDIVNAVADRVKENHPTSATMDVEAFEESLTRGRPPSSSYQSPERLGSQLGGFVWHHSIGTWDSPAKPTDEVRETDMIVTRLIVPADEARRSVVIDELRSLLANQQPDATWHYWRNLKGYLWALLNYRSDETAALIERYRSLAEKSELTGLNSIVSRDVEGICDSILLYWRRQDSLADPANDAVVGRWEIVRPKSSTTSSPVHHGFWVDLFLTRDHRFSAVQYRLDSPEGQPVVCRQSSGHWLAAGGNLRIVEDEAIHQESLPCLRPPHHLVWIDAPLNRERMVATDTSEPKITILRVGDLPSVMEE